jgi:imidazole glycerol-phosphate synthase subunit HisH
MRPGTSNTTDLQKQQKPPLVAIIDYEFGNVQSVANALAFLGANVLVSRKQDDLEKSDCLILPGVGAFKDGMMNLHRFGLVPLLEDLVLHQKKPFLGICVGMQLLAKKGHEGGENQGLGWLDAEVVRFNFSNTANNHPLENPLKAPLKVPHVGWNDVTLLKNCPLLGSASEEAHAYYFVHSYYLKCRETEILSGLCDYGHPFPAVVRKDNIFGVQFHPEKSQKYGLRLLKNFISLPHANPEPQPLFDTGVKELC